MGMAEPTTFHTAEMVRDLIQEDRHSPRYETVYGELLVSPSPRRVHQRVVLRLARRLADYLDREPVGEVVVSPADVSWGRNDVLVQPDVFVVPRDEPGEWASIRHLLLAAEVLSPSSGRADRFTKRRLYQAQGVPLYWMIDVDDRSVQSWTPDAEFPAVERETLVWHPAGVVDPFRLAVAELLGPA
jgi:Uma2 family endonuclease